MSPDSQRWLDSIHRRYELGPDEEVLVEQVSRVLDRITAAEAQVEADGLMLATRGGGTKVHPLVRVITDNRALLPRYVRELGLGEEEK
jgi:phage terminase small subunit